MKNHELLDLIGEVNEDYVQAADSNVVRPRFRWKALAACAACAVLAVGAYSVWQMAQPIDGLIDEAVIPLHAYTVMEGGGTLATEGELKVPAGGEEEVGGAYVPGYGVYNEQGEDKGGEGIDGAYYNPPGQDVSVQEVAAAQYDKLCQHIDMDAPPEWFAGAWLSAPDQSARLVVAIVNGFRTPELEAQIMEWTGGEEVVFQDAKYSKRYLDSLMDPAVQALDGTGLCSGVGVDVMANCLGLDIYSDEGMVLDQVLAELARLDPEGDAIRVRVFTDTFSTYDDEAAIKGPASVGDTPDEVLKEERAEPAIAPESFPTPIDESDYQSETGTVPEGPAGALPARTEDGHDIPGAVNDLPEKKCDVPGTEDDLAHYDLLGGAEDLPGYGLLY